MTERLKTHQKESNKTISSSVTGTFSNGLTWTEIHSYNQKTRPYCPYSFFTQKSTSFSPSSKGKLSLSFSSVFEKQLITGEECITQPLYSHFGIPLGKRKENTCIHKDHLSRLWQLWNQHSTIKEN